MMNKCGFHGQVYNDGDKSIFFAFFRGASTAYGSSQARAGIRPTAAGLHHSHSNEGSKPGLRPAAQFTATLDP